MNNHLSSHHNGSAPPSPSMSQSQQQGNQSRQPVSYPSPTSYPSPGLSSAQYSYPAPNNQQVNEPYRASPTGSNGSLSLPSMRSLDPLQQQAHPTYGRGSASSGSSDGAILPQHPNTPTSSASISQRHFGSIWTEYALCSACSRQPSNERWKTQEGRYLRQSA